MNFKNTQHQLTQYIQVTIFSAVLLFIIRLLELWIINHYGIHPTSSKIFFKYSINFDSFFVVVVSLIYLPIFLISILKSPKLALNSYKIVWFFLLIIMLILTHFFISGEYLLSGIIFQFSWSEIWHIISIEKGNSKALIWLLYLIIPICIFLFFGILKYKKEFTPTVSSIYIGIYAVAIIFVVANYKHFYKPSYQFDSQYNFYIGNNKIIHFTKSLFQIKKYHSELTPEEFSLAVSNFQSKFPQFDFTSKEYPLIHKENYENVLGKYFKKSKKSPNLVFIISESLGAGFSGLHPTTDHLLPYIDTLAMNGLYWQEFLSNCNRTFGVLPNVFASLVPGTVERGFANYNGEKYFGKRYPEHNSLIKELKNNNYFTSFFYGGWGAFDNYEFFIKNQKIDLYMDQDNFDSTRYLSPWKRKPKGFYWGYDDDALLHQFFDYEQENGQLQQPYLSIYLTLNMHEPYNISPKEYYDDDFIKTRLESLHLRSDSPFLKKDNMTLGSLFFYEDALRNFMNTYKQRDDYDNTIFFIFGDHYSLASFLNNPLGTYHVPFIIYSPLITKTEIFKGVSTHQDIAPSLIALLQENFGLQFTEEKHWLGQGLDTSTTFHCDRIAPLNIYSPDFPHLIYKDYFLTEDGTVLKIKENLQIEVVTAPEIIEEVRRFAKDFRAIDRYVCNQNKIWKTQ